MSDYMFFMKSGLARLTDLDTKDWKNSFALLENDQERFTCLAPRFLSAEYAFPRDPLHTWSRCWEYPYIYSNIVAWADMTRTTDMLHVLDVGSGVTFIPFSLATQGIYVTCTDINTVTERDLNSAIKILPSAPGRVDFKLMDGKHLPFKDDTIDGIYCISVLEHVSEYKTLISEMARVLKSRGVLFLTFDLDLRGDHELGAASYYDIKAELRKFFEYLHPEISTHPADMLISTDGPFGYAKKTNTLSKTWFMIKQRIIKPLLGRKPITEIPFYLAVEGLALVKKEEKGT